MSFTWDENHRFTDLIRKRLKHLARSPPKEPASRSKTSSAHLDIEEFLTKIRLARHIGVSRFRCARPASHLDQRAHSSRVLRNDNWLSLYLWMHKEVADKIRTRLGLRVINRNALSKAHHAPFRDPVADGGSKDAVEGRVARACASCRVNSGC